MSNPLPALSETYHSRVNVAIGANNTSAALIAQWFLWALKAHLVGEHSSGDVGGSRHANSLWSVVQSCDGASVSASDLWGSTFNAAKIIRATSGSAHSWIVLRNAANGYDLCIDCNSASNGSFQITSTKTSVGFSSGSTAVRPQATANSEEWGPLSTSLAPSSPTQLHVDFTTSVQHHAHFVTNNGGTRWWFGFGRPSTGVLNGWVAFWAGSGGLASDTRNQWWICGGVNSTGRGVPLAAILSGSGQTGATRRGLANAAPPSAGIRAWSFGGYALSGVDPESAEYMAGALDVAVAGASPAPCGTLPDLHFISGGSVGASVPSAASQARTIVGDLVVPCGVAMTV